MAEQEGGTLGHLKGCKHCVSAVFRLHVAAVPGSQESRKQAGANPAASPLINTPALRTEVWEAGYGKEPAQPANTWACVPCGQLGEQEVVKSQVPSGMMLKLRAGKAGSATTNLNASWASTSL